MFGFDMIVNYKNRCVGSYEDDDVFISTARVTDGRHPYETGLCNGMP